VVVRNADEAADGGGFSRAYGTQDVCFDACPGELCCGVADCDYLVADVNGKAGRGGLAGEGGRRKEWGFRTTD
jgi:hypothetical protein